MNYSSVEPQEVEISDHIAALILATIWKGGILAVAEHQNSVFRYYLPLERRGYLRSFRMSQVARNLIFFITPTGCDFVKQHFLKVLKDISLKYINKFILPGDTLLLRNSFKNYTQQNAWEILNASLSPGQYVVTKTIPGYLYHRQNSVEVYKTTNKRKKYRFFTNILGRVLFLQTILKSVDKEISNRVLVKLNFKKLFSKLQNKYKLNNLQVTEIISTLRTQGRLE